MNTILFHPTDTLFFRDGRPMGGAHSGHGAAWPLPHVLDSALHAALWRGGFKEKSHQHGQGDSHRFGALAQAGPFPVRRDATGDTWYFPRPADACAPASTVVTHLPSSSVTPELSSLPAPLTYGVLSNIEASKETPEAWWSRSAWDAYLHGTEPAPHFLSDREIYATEHSYGIAIDPATGTTGQGEAEGKIYSAQYLRLREDSDKRFALGVLATCPDKGPKMQPSGRERVDLLQQLFSGEQPEGAVIVGGQQRVASVEFHAAPAETATFSLPLPQGLSSGFQSTTTDQEERWLVKWVLLTPAIWPEIRETKSDGSPQNPHPGGWLPNWVFLDWDRAKGEARDNTRNGEVLLRSGKRLPRSYQGKHSRGFASDAESISARLVAAIAPKPIVVTGWTVHREPLGNKEGAKHTHLAVPAGAVYYFECKSKDDTEKLANALNWHGDTPGTAIRNRRSTLFGEKGFGLGVCGTWSFI